jgi:hypothetical protein
MLPQRRGNLDQSIREAEHNRIERLLEEFTDLRASRSTAKAAHFGASSSAAARAHS